MNQVYAWVFLLLQWEYRIIWAVATFPITITASQHPISKFEIVSPANNSSGDGEKNASNVKAAVLSILMCLHCFFFYNPLKRENICTDYRSSLHNRTQLMVREKQDRSKSTWDGKVLFSLHHWRKSGQELEQELKHKPRWGAAWWLTVKARFMSTWHR